MIAKRTSRRKDSQSSFTRLANYIARQSKNEASVPYKITNCGFDSLPLAVKEIEATQGRNTRSTTDKTYHLIVSFPAGEKPTSEQLDAIEADMCQAIGLGDHQRVSAVHDDTDNFHMHIAINKINPKTYKVIEPYYDKYRLDEACARLELEHGLKQDNRIDRKKTKSRGKATECYSGKAADMESHSGLESFKGWVRSNKDTLCQSLERAGDWESLHQGFAKFDITLRLRGAGLVISAKNEKVFMKASDLGREFSKARLEEKLGDFRPANQSPHWPKPEACYKKSPSHKGEHTSSLWDQYKSEKDMALSERRTALQSLRGQRDTEIEQYKRDYKQRKAVIKKDLLLQKSQKREACQLLLKNHQVRLSNVLLGYQDFRKEIYKRYSMKTWQEWLVDQGVSGNEKALLTLRSSVRRSTKGNESCSFVGKDEGQLFKSLRPKVQANGDILYHSNGACIRDSGDQLRVNAEQSGGLSMALKLACQKYGSHLSIQGDEKFKQKIVEEVVVSGQKITFSDSNLEKRRQILQEVFDAKKIIQEQADKERLRHQLMQSWIDQRNETHTEIYSIMQKKPLKESDVGVYFYKGFCKISDDLSVGLYERSGKVFVSPLTQRQVKRFRSYPIGSCVTVNKKGHVKFQEKSRGR